jgi:sugar phosphate isomerase/epimerase
MKYGIQTGSFSPLNNKKETLIKALSEFKALGGEVAELCYRGQPITPQDYADVAKETGIEIVSSHAGIERILHDTQKLAEEHLVFGCKLICTGSIPVRKGFLGLGYKKKVLKFCEEYNKAAEICKKYGVTLSFHNHRHDGYKKQLKTSLVEFLLEHMPEVDLCFDICWAYAAGIDAAAILTRYGKRVSVMHLKDYDGTKCCILGTGKVDVKGLMALGRQTGVRYQILEEETRNVDKQAAIKESMAYILANK